MPCCKVEFTEKLDHAYLAVEAADFKLKTQQGEYGWDASSTD